jgi:hypothetical protein
VEVDDRADVVRDVRQAVPVDQGGEAGAQPVPGAARAGGRARGGHLRQGVVAGHAGQRVGRERAADEGALADGREAPLERRHHPLAAADPARRRVAARDALAEDGEVGRDPEVALGAAHAEPERRDHLVEDQQRAVRVARLPHRGVVLRADQVGAALRADRLDDDGGRPAVGLVGGEAGAQRVEVAGRHLLGEAQRLGRDARRLQAGGAGDAQAEDDLVGPAVVRAADLDHVRLAGVGAGGAEGGHDGLGAAAEHAEPLDAGHQVVDQLGELDLVGVEHPGDGAAGGEEFGDLLADGGVVAAEDGGAAGGEEVGVAVAVHVPQVGALGADDLQRPGLVEREVVLPAAGDVRRCLGGGGAGAGGVGLVPGVVCGERLAGQAAGRGADEAGEVAFDGVHVRPGGYGGLGTGGGPRGLGCLGGLGHRGRLTASSWCRSRPRGPGG